MTLCPRCLLHGRRVRMYVDHVCDCPDRRCEQCGRPLLVTVALMDERGSLSQRSACGCFKRELARELSQSHLRSATP